MSLPKIEKLLLKLTVFLIPTNLAYHWITREAYVSGILVDYLIPKLYLSDLPILLLLLMWLFRSIHPTSIVQNITSLLPKLSNPFSPPIKPSYLLKSLYSFITNMKLKIISVALFLYLFTTAIFPVFHLSSFWFILKVFEFLLFALYLKKHYTLKELRPLLHLPLLFGLLFQSLVGLYQFINQSSLFGYLLLGEVDLLPLPTISRETFFSTRLILPYGTTPHPNVLAGYIVVTIAFLLALYPKLPKNRLLLSAQIGSISLSLLVLILVRSYSAVFALLSIILVKQLKKSIGTRIVHLLLPLLLVGSILILLLSPTLNNHSYALSDNPSLERRSQLISSSYKILSEKPIFGTGLNRFIPHLVNQPPITANYRFLQPVHNIYLLSLVELGLLGFFFLSILLFFFYRHALSTPLLTLPFLVIAIIGFFDHYPLTLQTGQLLTTLSLTLPLLKRS